MHKQKHEIQLFLRLTTSLVYDTLGADIFLAPYLFPVADGGIFLDLSTIIGICVAFGLMLMAILQGGPLGIFIDTSSLLIVFGGTLGNTLVHYPFKDVFDALNVAKKTLLYKETPVAELIPQLMEFANKARKEGILALQGSINEVNDGFLKKAMQMAVDGQEPATLRNMLAIEVEYVEMRHNKGANIFVSIGAYSPAMGMVGTLIGLVQMLQNMNDPSAIGPAMAVALLTTFYGAVIANVICLPLAGKLKNRSESEILVKTLMIEGMQSILSHAFIAPKLRESSFKK